jgi:hypothetical protein
MKRLFSAKSIAAAAVVLGAFGAATAAHARSDVVFSVSVQVPGAYGYVQPAPVYVQTRPTYVSPRPVYVQPHRQYGWDDRDGWRDGWRHRGHHRASFRGPWGDYDRDGVPNRYDHSPANPYRR